MTSTDKMAASHESIQVLFREFLPEQLITKGSDCLLGLILFLYTNGLSQNILVRSS